MEPDPDNRPTTASPAPPDPDDAATPTWHDPPSGAPVIGTVRPPTAPVLDAIGADRLPMYAADGGQVGAWWLSAASVIGTSHLASGRTRQDDYGFAILRDGSLLAAVTDGLGSYEQTAQIGAGLMIRALLAAMTSTADLDADDVLTAALLQAQQDAIDLGARIHGLTAEQLSCTLVACRLTESGAAAFARVGDAEAFLWSPEDAAFTAVFAGSGGTPVNVVTAACPRASADQIERIDLLSPTPILLCSDGLATDIHNSPTLREYLARAWHQPAGAAAMLDSLRYRRQGSHDDRTGLVVWPCPTTPATSESPGSDDEPMTFDRITTDPDRMGGAPCIRHLRITVAQLVAEIAEGATIDEILDEFPYLERPDIEQAIAYAETHGQ